MNYIDMPVSEFTAALASSSPAPGGGGASALAAALGAALACMVGNLTVGKKKYAENEPRLRELIAEAQSLRERLLTLVDADAEAFLPLAEAYRLPKDAPDRGAVMEKCLADAAAVPMEILELSCRVIALQEEFAALGSSLAVSAFFENKNKRERKFVQLSSLDRFSIDEIVCRVTPMQSASWVCESPRRARSADRFSAIAFVYFFRSRLRIPSGSMTLPHFQNISKIIISNTSLIVKFHMIEFISS